MRLNEVRFLARKSQEVYKNPLETTFGRFWVPQEVKARHNPLKSVSRQNIPKKHNPGITSPMRTHRDESARI